MNKEIERDLLSLLPSITLPLPRELVDVARSLLSQSRSKAGSLKQDEEIARGYVCSNLACERLKTKLNLPTIVARPPVAPKTYKKVYAYLDSTLDAGASQKQQKGDATGRSAPSTPSKRRTHSTNGTPSRTPARTPQPRILALAQSSSKRTHTEIDGDAGMPAWVMPTIRSLCRALKISHASPHIFVGVSSISKVIKEQQALAENTPSKKRARRSTGNDPPSKIVLGFQETHLPALIVVVTLFTRSHLVGAPQTEDYLKQRQRAVEVVTKTIPDDFKEDEDVTVAMIEALLREAENGWLDMEWYHNLPESDAASDEAAEQKESDAVEPLDDEERPVHNLQVPKRGFGSMMTDATDWLSDEKRSDFQRWKNGIMRKIAQIEKQEKSKGIAI